MMRIIKTNRVLLLLVGCVLALYTTAQAQTPAGSQRPNILFIRTDDQDFQTFFDALPNGRPVMKNVRDLIVRRGAYFERSFVSFPLCCPSRASTLTGQYAHNHNVLANSGQFGGFSALNHTNTLPIWLQQSGYYTIHVGKYMNGYQVLQTSTGLPPPPPGWNAWFTTFGNTSHHYFNFYVYNGQTIEQYFSGAGGYQTDVMTRKAQSFLMQRPYGTQPFYLQLDYLAPHEDLSTGNNPPLAAPRHQGLMNGASLPMSPSFNEADVSDKPLQIRQLPPLNAQDINDLTINYRRRTESLLAVDEGVGKILQTLRATGQHENTLIVFTSDNGYMLGEHRKKGKFLPYEPLQVPLAISGPGIPHGKIISDLVMNVDLTPTFLEYASAGAGLAQDGRSLVPLLTNPAGTIPWRLDILTENPLLNCYRGLRTFDAATGSEYLYSEYDYDFDNVVDEKELYALNPDACTAGGDPYLLESQHANPCYSALIQQLQGRISYLRNCVGSGCR